MESNRSKDERWQQMVAARDELDADVVEFPRAASPGAEPRRRSQKAARFGEALAFDDAWSGITEARERRARRAA